RDPVAPAAALCRGGPRGSPGFGPFRVDPATRATGALSRLLRGHSHRCLRGAPFSPAPGAHHSYMGGRALRSRGAGRGEALAVGGRGRPPRPRRSLRYTGPPGRGAHPALEKALSDTTFSGTLLRLFRDRGALMARSFRASLTVAVVVASVFGGCKTITEELPTTST